MGLHELLSKLRTGLPNPGKYEEVHQECQAVLGFLDQFDGAKFELNKGVNQFFGVTHSVSMGSSSSPGGNYEFAANFVKDKWLLMGRLDPKMNMHARVHYMPASAVTLRGQAQFSSPDQGAPPTAQVDLDYKGSDSFSQLRAGTQGIVGLSYLQSVTPRLSLGTDWLMQSEPRRASECSFAARYNAPKFIATAQYISLGVLIASYTHRVTENVSYATELQVATKVPHESMATVGGDYKMRTGSFRFSVNSQWKINAILERKLNPEVSFILSGVVDHKKGAQKFGCGLVVGGH